MSEFEREPIFWTSTRPGYNQRDREIVRFEDGRRIVEKVPQRGHQGDYENRKTDSRCARARWLHVVTDKGNWIRMVLTNAAAHFDANTDWGQYQRAKARYFGWFPVWSCPLALLSTGELKRGQIVDRSLLEQKPCEPGSYSEQKPCPHCVSETDARRARHAADEVERYKNYVDATEKTISANRQDMREQTETLAKAIASALGKEPEPEKPAPTSKKERPER
jgi:hypothetical protein